MRQSLILYRNKGNRRRNYIKYKQRKQELRKCLFDNSYKKEIQTIMEYIYKDLEKLVELGETKLWQLKKWKKH